MSSLDGAIESDLASTIRTLEETEPLVQAVTNEVTMNDVANCILHWGALPVMADSPGDAGEMVALAGALVCNVGQVPETKVEAMHEAAQAANENDVPVVLDPVGVGATPTRRAVAESLLSSVDFTVIKGNYGEISALAGVEAEVKGVESIGEYEGIDETASALADATGATVVASGVEDVVADDSTAVSVRAGHDLMGAVVGTGCLLGASLAAFCGAGVDPRRACVHGTLAFGLAGERAAEMPNDGPASYRTAFLDSVAGLSPGSVESVAVEDRVAEFDE